MKLTMSITDEIAYNKETYIEPTKQECPNCGRTLKISHFTKQRGTRAHICRDCVADLMYGTTIDVNVKPCPSCGEVKSINEFNNNPNTYDGLQSECKTCINERARKTAFKRRGFGCAPLNKQKSRIEHFHHLHIDDDHSVGIYIPKFVHNPVYHNSFSGAGMDEINAIAIQCWLDADLYDD